MSTYIEKIESLKLKLQSAKRQNLRNSKVENSLRNLERSLTEEISQINSEYEFILQQMQDLKLQISQINHQINITDICIASEKSQIENHILNINTFKQGYEDMFARERELSELRNKELKEKEAQQEEIERQKLAKEMEIDEQKGKEAAAIEVECEAIERECTVLTKRNNAVMCRMRRRLLEAETTRRELMERKGLIVDTTSIEN